MKSSTLCSGRAAYKTASHTAPPQPPPLTQGHRSGLTHPNIPPGIFSAAGEGELTLQRQ